MSLRIGIVMKVVRFVEVCATSTVIPFVVPYRFIDLANETTKHSSRFLCLRPGIGRLSLSVSGFFLPLDCGIGIK